VHPLGVDKTFYIDIQFILESPAQGGMVAECHVSYPTNK
jgi:hypothetical protein